MDGVAVPLNAVTQRLGADGITYNSCEQHAAEFDAARVQALNRPSLPGQAFKLGCNLLILAIVLPIAFFFLLFACELAF